MASSSSSSTQNSYQYDVFLSFRGEDTRKNFVDHLYDALQRQEIHTFKDDQILEKGKRIKDEMLKSIEESKFYIIVFSKNYASSSWCLDELVKIMECQKATEQIAYPVFYDVDPSQIRKQLGPVGEAFSRHSNKEEVGKWRDALEEASNLAGWDLRNTADGHEAKVINRIVENISLELRFVNVKFDERLVGMESRIKDILSSLEMGVEDVRMIGIKGIGGGGKTTLARAVFEKICFSFEGHSFVENVREVSKPSMLGLRSLQEQVLSSLLNERSFTVGSVHEGKEVMKKRLYYKKVILVLDDVDHLDQLEALAGGLNWFKGGSRIIITTRDEQMLVAHRVKPVHEVNLLSQEEAMCLFSRYAFGSDIPIQMFKELSLKVVHYAAGLPLTIKVLGSFLCGKDELEWEDAIERLQTIPLKETLEKLELSYTDLEDDYKDIFLDVVCLMKGWVKEDAIRALESCGCHARKGLRVLEQKSLITISSCHQQLGMHDHIEEMGLNIVRRSHPDDRNRHSRLWIRREIEDVQIDDLVTDNAISWHVKEYLCSKISTKGFRNMKKLRSLHVFRHLNELPSKIQLQYLSWQCDPHSCLPKTIEAFNLVAHEMLESRIEQQLWEKGEIKVAVKGFRNITELRSLHVDFDAANQLDIGVFRPLNEILSSVSWKGYPHSCIPKMIQALNLFALEIPERRIGQELWGEGEIKVFKKLRYLELSYSQYLTTLDCRFFPHLKKLNLERCYHLAELHVPIGCLKNLVYLDLNHSSRIKSLLFVKQLLESLEVLDQSDLYLTEFPDILPGQSNYSLVKLNFSTNNVKQVPSSIGNLKNLVSLDLSWCKNLKSLPQSMCSYHA